MDNLKNTEDERLKEKLLNTPLSEYASKQVSDTENEILKIETEISKTSDAKEREELEFILDYLKKKLEIESKYKEKVSDVDESINELTETINKPINRKFSFQRIFYGETGEKLTRSRIIGTNILFFFLAASAYGMWADFVPNENIISSGKFLSYITALFITILFSWAVFTGGWKTRTQKKFAQVLLSITFIPLIFFGISWLTFSYGMPALYTRILGNDISLITNMEKDKNSSRRSCDYRLKGDVMSKAFPSYLCINKEYYLKEPKKVSVRLTGKESYFGKFIVHIYDNTDNKALQPTPDSGG